MNRMMMTAAIAVALVSVGGCKQQPAADDNSVAAPAAAAASIDGDWKVDMATVKFEVPPDEWTLKDGAYSCATCLPTPYKDFVADGAFHPVTDRPSYDNMSITTVDDKTVKIARQKAGKDVGNNTMTVSADGKTLTNNWVQLDNANGKQTTGSVTFNRVGDAPAGAHAVSGKWAINTPSNISPEALSANYKVDGDTFTASFGTGESFTAKLDGSETPITGDSAGATTSVVRDGAGYKITTKVSGKVVDIRTLALAGDGTIDMVSTDPRDNSKVSYKLVR